MGQHQSWKDQLVDMGFSRADVERADRAGLHDVTGALDFFQNNRTVSSTDGTDFSYPQGTQPNEATAPLYAAASRGSTLSNARNSLDRIDVARVPFDTSSPNDNRSRQQSPAPAPQPDDDLKRALELSRKEQDERDMAQALRMSKQEGVSTAYNDRDPDFMRAIEESLKETPRLTDDRAVSWQSHAYNNGKEILRENLEDPVGLHNIGNTCYLNSLLQVYFHLPDFRRAIMAFRAPCDLDTAVSNKASTPQAQPILSTNIPDTLVERKSETTSDWADVPLSTQPGVVMSSALRKDDPLLQPPPDSMGATRPEAPSVKLPVSKTYATPLQGETSVSDKSDNLSEQQGEIEQTSKRHAVEFVIELQRLFAAMALGNQTCVDPTSVARAIRDGDGNPIRIGDQQDASEFNHLFLDVVEKGLCWEDTANAKTDANLPDAGVTEATTNPDINASASPSTGVNSNANAEIDARLTTSSNTMTDVNINPVGNASAIIHTNDNFTAHASTDTTGNGNSRAESNKNRDVGNYSSEVSKGTLGDIVRDLFVVKFRQEVRLCDADGFPAYDNRDTRAAMVTEGETNCIIVDATTKKERDLYSGLEDYAVARIEYNATGSGSDASSSKATISGKDKLVTAAIPIKDGERTMLTPPPTLSKVRDGEEAVDSNGAVMQDVEMEPRPSNYALKSVWLTKLPPVLVIYLQRVRFIREKSIAEKVHDKYDFAPEIALDRYLEANRVAAGRARERIMGIRKERRRLNALVRKYRSFPLGIDGDGCSVVPSNSVDGSDIEMGEGELFSAGGRIRKRLREALNPSSELFAVDGLSKESVDSAIGTIEWVLDSDRKQCERYERELEALETEAEVYRGLDAVKYRLHAVLVHDGAPSGGHYWTFIRDWRVMEGEFTWMKFSDSLVSRVSEADMLLWSAGGHGHASAYCLIYTSAGVMDNSAMNASIAEECRQLLPSTRLQEIDQSRADNAKETADEGGKKSDVYSGLELKNQSW